MRWDDLELGDTPDRAIWSKPPASTKQKEQHEVPLSAPARQLLMEVRQRQTANRRAPARIRLLPAPDRRPRGEGQTRLAVDLQSRRHHQPAHSRSKTQLRQPGDQRRCVASLVGALLGHSNPSTTQRYAHMLTDLQRRTVENVGAVITAAAKGGPWTEPTRSSARHRSAGGVMNPTALRVKLNKGAGRNGTTLTPAECKFLLHHLPPLPRRRGPKPDPNLRLVTRALPSWSRPTKQRAIPSKPLWLRPWKSTASPAHVYACHARWGSDPPIAKMDPEERRTSSVRSLLDRNREANLQFLKDLKTLEHLEHLRAFPEFPESDSEFFDPAKK